MNKTLILLAAAGVAFAACKKEQVHDLVQQDQELSVMSFNHLNSKGYVEGAVFADTPYDRLHRPNYTATVENDARTMLLSAYLTPQSGIAGDYFTGKSFKRDGNDNLWHNYLANVKAPIYWPIGGTLDFLALSTTTAIAAEDLAWNEENAAHSFTLNAGTAFKQDDILFSSVCGRKVGTNATVDMEFQHAQAWIQFQLNATESGVITIKKIELQDIYEKGSLNVMNNLGNAVASWNFRKEMRKDVEMDDTYGVLNTPLVVKEGSEGGADDTIGYMDMLIPEQNKTSFLITYTLKNQPDVELKYLYTLAHENWLMGNKYVYKINFGINEITVDPSVETFAGGNVSDFSPVDPDVIP